jgi:NAD(P)H-flavin reductase
MMENVPITVNGKKNIGVVVRGVHGLLQVYAMIIQALEVNDRSKFSLIISCKKKEFIPYYEELSKYAQNNAQKFHLYLCLDE